jgi:hypothetical protein
LTENGILTVDDTITGALAPWNGVGITLAQNRPNPFRAGTVIQFGLDRRAWPDLELTIFDTAVRIVWRSDLGGAAPGPHATRWDGRDTGGSPVGSGVYYYRLEGNGVEQVRKMIVLR